MQAAILGTGFIANTHAQALRALGVGIKCAVDRDIEAARDFSDKWGVKEYGGDLEPLFSEDIDCVHVCTPPALHYDTLLRLMEKGKNIICEKPLCLEYDPAARLADEAEKRGLICAVNFNVRYHMACQRARKLIGDGSFGPIYLIHGSYLQEYHTLPAPAGWRYSPELSGKMRAVTEIGSHWFDLAQYLSGKKITAVSATFGNFNPKRYIENGLMYREPIGEGGAPVTVDTEDAAAVSLRFEDGALGSVLLSEITHGRQNRLSLEVTGYNKSLWWNSEENNTFTVAEKGGPTQTEIFAFGNGFTDTFRDMFGAVYGAIEKKSPDERLYPGMRNAARNVLICGAAYESASSGSKWVELN